VTLWDDEDRTPTEALERYGFPEALIDRLARDGANIAEELDGLLTMFPGSPTTVDAIVRREMETARDALRRIARLVIDAAE
jgi:hypothetical protein